MVVGLYSFSLIIFLITAAALVDFFFRTKFNLLSILLARGLFYPTIATLRVLAIILILLLVRAEKGLSRYSP